MNANKTFLIFLTALGLNIYSLNLCHKISHCALVFTLIMLFAKIMFDKFGTQKTLLGTGFVVLANIIISNSSYYIGQHIITGLVSISLLSVFLSLLLGNIITRNLALSSISCNVSYFVICALVDGFIMSAFLLHSFSMNKIFSMLIAEISYKLIYASVAVALYHSLKYLAPKLNFFSQAITE